MSISEELALNYLNSAIIQAEIENAKEYDLDLSIVKFDIKENDPKKFKEILGFVYKYLDFMTILLESENTFIAFLRNSKIHATVLLMKNLNLALKLKFATTLKSVAVTNFDKSDDIISLIERLNSFYLKSKLTKNNIYYGTKWLNFQELDSKFLTILKDNPNIFVYGIYKDASIRIDAKINEITNEYISLKVPKEYLSFLQKQSVLYFEHSNIPDAMSANVIKADFEKSNLDVTKFKFIDQSPLHRRNLRVEPPVPIKASLIIDDLIVDGLINDISITSVLFTTQLNYVEELEKLGLIDKTFRLQFTIENLYNNSFDIEMKATIFKVMGNQLVLSTYATSETQNIIKEYINMCYQHLLLQVQGKVV